jgi:hypothetical protein
VFDALAQDPARLLEKSVAEPHPGLAAVVAGVMVGDELGKSPPVDADPALANVVDQEVEDGDETVLL